MVSLTLLSLSEKVDMEQRAKELETKKQRKKSKRSEKKRPKENRKIATERVNKRLKK